MPIPLATTKNVQRSFRLDAALDELLTAKAKELDRSRSWVINRALEGTLIPEDQAMARAMVRGVGRESKK